MKQLTTALVASLILMVTLSKAQFVSTYNSNFGNEKKIEVPDRAKLVEDAGIYLSDDAKTYLDEIRFPIGIIEPELAYSFQKQCRERSNIARGMKSEITKIVALPHMQKLKKTEDLMKDLKITYLSSNEVDKYLLMDNEEVNSQVVDLAKEIKWLDEGYEYYRTINSIDGNPKMIRRFFPLRSTSQAAYFYFGNNGEKKISLVQDVMFQRNYDGSNSLNSEILSGVLPIPIFPIKMSIGSTITQVAEKVDSTEVAANKLPYGGFFNLTMSVPLFFSSTIVGEDKHMIFYLPIENRFNIDEVKDGISLGDTYHFNEISASFLASIDLVQSAKTADNVNIFAGVKAAYYSGNSKFSDKVGHHDFSLLQVNAGIKLAKKFTIAINIPLSSSASNIINNQSGSIALKFEPSGNGN